MLNFMSIMTSPLKIATRPEINYNYKCYGRNLKENKNSTKPIVYQGGSQWWVRVSLKNNARIAQNNVAILCP